MSATAPRVLILGDDDSSDLQATLSASGYQPVLNEGSEAGVFRPDGNTHDVVVISLAGNRQAGRDPCGLAHARQYRSAMGASATPIIAIGPQNRVDELVRDAPPDLFDDVLAEPLNTALISARIRSLARLNTMHAELQRRMATWQRLGVDAPFHLEMPERISDANLLIVGASTDYPVIERALAPCAMAVGALTVATALDYLERRSFDLVVINGVDDLQAAETFCVQVRRNPTMYNLPIVILSEPDLAHCDFLEDPHFNIHRIEKPIDERDLRFQIMSLARENRFRDSLRDIYARARHLATSDALTGLYSRGFLHDHLSTMISVCGDAAQMFSVAYFDLVDIGFVNAEHGYIKGDRVIRQLGELMGMLLRGEDLMARYSGTRFAAILPATHEAAARVALDRALGVVNHTEFSFCENPETAGIGDIIRVQMAYGVTEYRPGDDPEIMLERARSSCPAP